ncbi:MAG TPA: hypothetical protein VEL11_17000 [Candidatus Bathyarchaeia archaeon]|nr:hypothetical protein [Candidatus Bathyarchaeia archaeon]
MDTTNKVDIHDLPIDLQFIKEDLITTDSINQLDIADGLKELLISKGFTLKLLLDTSVSGLAKILGIDSYVASIIHGAVRKVVKDQRSAYSFHRGDKNMSSLVGVDDYKPESR